MFEQRSVSLECYYKEANKFKRTLTKDEEKELIIKAQAGCATATDALFKAHMLWVVKQANGYIGLGVTLDDLIMEGNIALLTAIKKFDVNSDSRLLTYARWWIQRAMNHAHVNYGRSVKLPMNQEIDIYKAKQRGEDVEEPTKVAIDKPVGDEGRNTIGDLVLRGSSLAQEWMNNEDIKDKVQKVLGKLPERESEIMRMHYGIDELYAMPSDTIADHFGMTPTRVNQLIKKSERILKEAI